MNAFSLFFPSFSVQFDPQGGVITEGFGRVTHHRCPHVSTLQTEHSQRGVGLHTSDHEHDRTAAVATAEVKKCTCWSNG